MNVDTILAERHVALESVFNFRDLGGYPAGRGRTVRWGRIYRADGLHHLSDNDIETVRSLGLRTVVDLRTMDELHERGRFPVDTHPVDHHHLPLIAEIWPDDDEVGEADQYLAARYAEMAEEGGPALAATMGLLARHDSYPLVFHCAAGKDRTGVVAALLLSLLGVRDDVVVHDYTLSTLGMGRMQAWFEAHSPAGAEAMAKQPAGWLAAPPTAMATFLEHIREVHGSPEGYLSAQGVTATMLSGVRANLLC